MGVSIDVPVLNCSVLETVQGVVVGFNCDGDLVIQDDLSALTLKAREDLGQAVVQIGKKILENKPQLH